MRDATSCILAAASALLIGIIATRYIHALWFFSPFYNAQVHFSLLAGLFAAASLAARRHVVTFLLLAASLALAAHLPLKAYGHAEMASPAEAAGKQRFRLMSFNILASNLENGIAIREEILASGADVVVVMEAAPLASQLEALSAAYPHRLGCGAGTDACDLLVLSRHPIAAQEIGALSDLRRDRFMQIDVELAGRTVHVAAAHLSKPWFDDYHTIELFRLWRRLDPLEGPLVLAGDFNASTIAPDMMWFLARSGLKTARHEPATWPVAMGRFGIPLDHVYARPPLKLVDLSRIADDHGSNHFGLVADFIIVE